MILRSDGITAGDIARQLNLSERSIRKRNGIDRFIVGRFATGRGRPVTLFSREALSLWGVESATAEPRVRSERSDWGVPRCCTPEQWEAICLSVRELYMANAQANLRLACEQAVRRAGMSGVDLPMNANQIYKRLTCKNVAPDGLAMSSFYRDNWEVIRRSGLRKKDIALEIATKRYGWLPIFESAGWAGAGFGAMRGWSIDVRKNDIWTTPNDRSGGPEFGAAMYIRCALTGYPLWVEPVKTETSAALIRGYLKCMLAWRKCPDLFVSIDNGKAMISERTLKVIETTLPKEAWAMTSQIPELFHDGSPILRNLPNIPRSPFKAALERSFKLIKDEFDATRHARNFQGGTRAEAVQLAVTNRPAWQYMSTAISTTDEYFDGLGTWLYSDYVSRERPRMFPSLIARGISPTIGAAFQYYFDPTESLPTNERIANLLYWATPKPSICKASLGYVDAVIGGEFWHCVSEKLDHHYYEHRIAVLPIPDTDFAVLMLADNPSSPKYLATARNAFVRSMDELRAVHPIVIETQNAIRTGLREERQATPPAVWENTTSAEQPTPALPDGAQAWLDGIEIPIHELDDDARPTDLDAIVRDVDSLLD
jgi:hypothetical protein